jgi:acetyl coenzyme A synthetase (ADP forming)-like protein
VTQTESVTDVVLRDGSTLRTRPVRSDDEPRLLDFFHGLSESSRRFRFFSVTSDESLKKELHRHLHNDPGNFAVVATEGPSGRIVGHAEYMSSGDDSAEVGFAVADAYQGRGLGTILLGELARAASAAGIGTFRAVVMPENYNMLSVFRESGFRVKIDAAPDEIRVSFPTALTEEANARFEMREWTSAVNAMKAFFRPRSVAVVGASRQRGTIGAEVLHNLLAYGFNGPVLPVNPTAAGVVQSIVAYPGVEDIPGPVDLAVIVVPRGAVLGVAEACGRKGVRALVVISSGFSEVGGEGIARQQALVRTCREYGMRLIGPNCMGILNTDADVRLNATFAPMTPPAGRVAFMSQSGALGLSIIDYANALGLGLSTFVSIGNKADISGNDLIRYWEQDPQTDVILLYLESFGNPRKFSRIARQIGRVKPIVAVKSGRSAAGVRASGSHTGALLAASDVTVDALFAQAGVIRTDRLEGMFDVASLLASQPLPKGRRVAILTNAGGPGILCADACEADGLEVPALGDATQAALRAMLPGEASVGNPVDMIASASAAQYQEAIGIIGRDPKVDAIVVIFIPPLVTKPEDVARAIVAGARELAGAKPVLTVFMQARGVPDELRSADVRLPSYAFPEDAAGALARVARYAEWRMRPIEAPAKFPDVRRDEATALVASALGRKAEWLGSDEVWTLLQCYGIPVLEQRVVTAVEDAGRAAKELAGPVALKAVAPGLVHKTEVGAVQLGIEPSDVTNAAREMETRLRQAGLAPTGYVLQRMATRGVEMIVGVVHDRQFGPVIACGAGGVLVELIKDVSVRLAPLSRTDAVEMVRQLKSFPLLGGYRGASPGDVDALVDTVLRISALVEDLPQIAELDLNPILVHEKGVTVVDARVRLAASEDDRNRHGNPHDNVRGLPDNSR